MEEHFMSHPMPSPGKEQPEGETVPRTHYFAKRDGLVRTYKEGVNTLYDHIIYNMKKFAPNMYLGKRIVKATDGSVGGFEWSTYAEALENVENFAAGLRALCPELTRQSNLGLYSTNRPEWIIADFACFFESLVAVPLYDTLGDESIEFICNHAELKVIVASLSKMEKLLQLVEKTPTLKTIICMDEEIPANLSAQAEKHGIRLLPFSEVIAKGAEANAQEPYAPNKPLPEDLSVICYTSGTTGKPKGVMIPHSSFVAMISALIMMVKADDYADNDQYPLCLFLLGQEYYLSYLPLAHIYEHLLELVVVATGTRVGFSQGDPKKVIDDVGALRPTGFAAVPRVLQKIFDRVTSQIQNAGIFKRSLFNLAYESKRRQLQDAQYSHWLWDRLVFKAIKDRMGGRVRAIMSAGAPLSAELMEFSKICFGCEVLQAYGQTETTGAATFTYMNDPDAGHAGLPVPSVEIKLVDVPEMRYFSTDLPYPRGEVCVRGPSCFTGYYKEPQMTAEVIDADGWVHTGDVGMWDAKGRLVIIDRKKHIFKLSQGEYVAPEKVENVLLSSPIIGQIFVHGDPHRDHLVAVVFPDFESLRPVLAEKGITYENHQEICENPEVRDLFLSEIRQYAKGTLKGFEIPKAIHLCEEEPSVANNMMTATMKLRRVQIRERFEEELQNLYRRVDVIVSAATTTADKSIGF